MKRLFIFFILITHGILLSAEYFCHTKCIYENKLPERLAPSYVNLGAKFLARIKMAQTVNRNCANNINTENNYNPLLENTSWINVSYFFEPPMIANVYLNNKDTTINNKKYRVIKQHIVNVDAAEVYTENLGMTTLYLYEDKENQRVYQYSEYYKRDLLLYDFAIQTGDKMPSDSLRRSVDSLFVLRDISTIENVGFSRKQYTFVHNSDTVVWIEGIGNYTDFTIPYALKHAETSRILCVHKNDETVYDTGTFKEKSCEYVKQIFEDNYVESTNQVSVDSSPASKILRDGQLYILRDGKVYTLQGIEVK